MLDEETLRAEQLLGRPNSGDGFLIPEQPLLPSIASGSGFVDGPRKDP